MNNHAHRPHHRTRHNHPNGCLIVLLIIVVALASAIAYRIGAA